MHGAHRRLAMFFRGSLQRALEKENGRRRGETPHRKRPTFPETAADASSRDAPRAAEAGTMTAMHRLLTTQDGVDLAAGKDAEYEAKRARALK